MSQRAMSSPESADYIAHDHVHIQSIFSQPEGKVRPGGSTSTHHKHRPATIKPRAVRVLPDALDLLRVPSYESRGEVRVCALDGFSVALKRAFAPADDSQRRFDAHEQPTRGNTEDLAR